MDEGYRQERLEVEANQVFGACGLLWVAFLRVGFLRMGLPRAGLLLVAFQLASTYSCGPTYSPKPRGYFRIEFPARTYETFRSGCPFEFEYPAYGHIEPSSSKNANPCWIDLVYPEFNARLHLSYVAVRDAAHLEELVEDARKFAFAHVARATGINQHRIDFQARGLHGISYEIHGNVASGTQFFVSDRVAHYLRGALYFNESPRADSIRPVVEFLRHDIDSLIRSLRWKEIPVPTAADPD